MPALADKLEALAKRREALRGLSATLFSHANQQIVDLLEQVELAVHRLGKWREYEAARQRPGQPLLNIAAWLREVL